MDEFIDQPQHGDFLIRNVMGMDENSGAVAIGELLKEGQLVQFHLRDAETSAEDLVAVLERYARGEPGEPGSGRPALFLSRSWTVPLRKAQPRLGSIQGQAGLGPAGRLLLQRGNRSGQRHYLPARVHQFLWHFPGPELTRCPGTAAVRGAGLDLSLFVGGRHKLTGRRTVEDS